MAKLNFWNREFGRNIRFKVILVFIFITILLLAIIISKHLLTYENLSVQSKQYQNGIFGRSVFEQNPNATLGNRADPNYRIHFPLDHRPHVDFDIEWWYLTANLHGVDEEDKPQYFGLQWTLFRFRNPAQLKFEDAENTWGNQHIYMAHASVHSKDKHWFAEKFARGAVGNAGTMDEPFELFIDNWQWINTEDEQNLLPAKLHFSIPLVAQKSDAQVAPNSNNSNSEKHVETLSVTLNLSQSGPYVKHGDNGYSIKSSNGQHASHYYSAPFVDVAGQFKILNTESKSAISVSGKAWFDQEWTSQLLDTATLGWDWLSLHLQDGSKVMAFRMRLRDQEDHITGSYISPKGVLTTLAPASIQLTPENFTVVNSKRLPLSWRLTIPSRNIDIQIKSRKTEQWNPAFVSYYEGMVEVSGSHLGEGFLELTGY
ncbi:lipocalin-like domain-containing protein [Glaciecola petra]|uniref:Lipocalin-like domain-containing protein n=1 Tax=Glaciecola petra TaxID=3075602 RepID=A0ABU2ZVH2_9ALTE|nr:lipocalin-like domain-containing protein [Aestuariibacter sp. P117]MDT0596405.1 lipocalin-like domain-containing protein [Aestuariibacter sp. P117]